MSLAIISPNRDITPWLEIFKKTAGDIPLEIYPNIKNPAEVSAVMLWQHPKGSLQPFPNLKLICSMGAGVDHILGDDTIPADIPITRIVDSRLTFSMTNYVVMGVLNHHRQILRYQADKQARKWDMSNPEIPVNVGVMGVGELGGDVLDKLSLLGINVYGYGNSPKPDFDHPYYYGEQLETFLSKCNVLVCLLPLTAQTDGILNIELFRKCTKGTYLINVARGKHLVEEDLITALEEGHLSGALLDVFQQEPLPKNHPFWEQEKISITPHIASITNPEAAAPQIIENYRNLENGLAFINQIDRKKGY
ncbi:2-hydroxyacid dehydrogenase [Echinicola vietnamensis]|uniref:Phosphoglycerate dehydrogenase-like oxidoreductase n=1 Tax=Echinicola vietnamensis (strain DSM 17526 / LMG 23754 / KMM 6221) TaxID=926556 RepID=L0G2C8_ECHVK|nr:glyoxylate/hydroxypyruvate reductase A [Echinicola vietnamensis]AGA79687.1 phosphoglycerate dehydrogenase-like oxidoreductase [Echinicola vietnamensis DSM 17526]